MRKVWLCPMPAFLLLNILILIQPALQVSESDSFLIYNEKLKLCIQSQKSFPILDYCDKDNEGQHFKWISNDQVLNMAVKLCLAVPSKSDLARVMLSPCNETTELQKWECRNDNLLVLDQEDLFLNPEGGQASRLILSKTATSKSTWKIYGTKENLCSKHYEALYTLRGNAQGAPCVFPFKYRNKLYAQCIKGDDEHGQLWCGTTADVDRDSLTGYCPIKDDHDELFWNRNQWTGDLYQINSDSALTWYQARKSCQQQNAELLSITDLQEQVYVTGLTSCMPADLWIGLNSLDDESGWQWMGNYPLRYLNWAPGSPSPETEKICGSMLSKDGKWENNKCQEKLGYICKKANSSLDAFVIPSDGFHSITCPNGWVAYADHCYHLSRDPKTWKSAVSSCRKEGGDLISIHHPEEYSFVISQLGYQPTDLLWIGLNDQKTQMYYEWSDGTKVTFTKWQKGKPTQINDVQNECVIMSGEGGYWADYFCEVELGYICKRKPSEVLPEEPETSDPNCQRGWKRHGVFCYLIRQTSLAFSEAKMFCETNKGYLTSVENRYEQAYLTSLVGLHPEKYFWIGLSDVQQPGTFNWTSGDGALFTHWNSEMPGRHSGCVAMRTGTAAGLWDVVNCEEKAAFICKQWAEGVTTTPAPKPTPLQPCPTGWRPSSTRNVCFKAYTRNKRNMKSWFEAREFCRAVGGELVSIHSEEEQKILEEMCSEGSYWIGLHNVDPDKGFTWSDGSNLNFERRTAWFLYEEDARCGGIRQHWSRWIPFHCDSFLSWVCQIKRGVPLKPEPSDDFDYLFKIIENGWILYNDNEYYVSNTSTSAERARTVCRRHGGDLTVIESETERKFLWKYNKRYGTHFGDLYIGLTVGPDGEFGWLDQTPVTYAAWAPGEPNNGNDDETCVAMKAITGLWYETNCGTTKKFICERHNSSVRSTVAPTTPAPVGGCADGWLFFNNKCFQVFGFNEEERKTWSDARTACKKQGGNLASITSKAFQAFLTVHLKSASTNAWIGLNNIGSEHSFLWTDESGVDYLNWAKGFPHYWSEDCVYMMKEPEKQAGYWKTGPCSAKKSYICKRNSDLALSHPETTTSASGYTVFGNSSYSLIGPQMTWEAARKKCHSQQSELASIVTPYIQSFLLLQVLKYNVPVWIGLNSNVTGEHYKWISNQRLVYTDWGPEEPKQKIACVYLHPDGHWKTGNCSETFYAVCERHHGKIPTEPPQTPGKCPESKQNQISWIPFRAHCYKFYTGWFRRPEAHFKCSQLGGTLASIEDLTELNFLVEHTQQNTRWNYWIGLIRNIEGQWLWEDKTEVDFVNWEANQPTFEPQDYSSYYSRSCASMKADNGEWYKQPCRYSNGYICKRHKIIEETTMSPTKSTDQEDSSASAHGRVIKVVFPLFFILILIGAGTALYIVYRRRFQQQQTTGSFDNAVYNDNRILIQSNNDSEVHVEDKGI